MTTGPRTFRMSLLITYVVVMVWVNVSLLALIALPTVLFRPANQWAFMAESLGRNMVGGAVAALVACGLVVLLFPVRVSADGLQGPDFWGRKTYQPWAAIRTIRPLNMLGLRYLLLTADGVDRKLWLPLFVRNKADYIDAIAAAAGDDHLVTQALRAHLGEREWQE